MPLHSDHCCCPGSWAIGPEGCCSPQCCEAPYCCSPVGCSPCFCTPQVVGYAVALALMWAALPFAMVTLFLDLFTASSLDSVTLYMFGLCIYQSESDCQPFTQGCGYRMTCLGATR